MTVLFTLAALALAPLLTHNPEPSHKGRSLSAWLEIHAADPANPAGQEAADAVRQIGTNALPYLIEWYGYEPPSWREKLASVIAKSPAPISQSSLAGRLAGADPWRRVELARLGFVILGSDSRPAIPSLIKMATNETSVSMAFGAGELLGYLGPAAVGPLLGIVTNSTNLQYRMVALSSLGNPTLGAEASIAVPTLLQCLEDPSEGVAAYAARALGAIRRDPQEVIPALTAHLADPRVQVAASAADALGCFGASAHQAIPSLSQMAQESSAWTSSSAKQALRAIAPGALTNAPPQ